MKKQELEKQLINLEVYTPELLQFLMQHQNSLMVHSKVETKLFKHVDNRKFRHILKALGLKMSDSNVLLARELCMLFLTNFNSTHYNALHSDDTYVKEGYVVLNSQVLKNQTRVGNKYCYTKIIDLLINERIIMRGRNYKVGERSYEYRLGITFWKKGFLSPYKIQTEEVMNKQGLAFNSAMERALKTSIGKMSLKLRSQITWVDDTTVLNHLKQEAKKGYTNKKGAKLVNKHNRYNNQEGYVFVEDYLDLYKFVRDTVFVPYVSEEKGTDSRVADFFNMLPKIVRPLLKVMGRDMIEVDFNTLHPNIIQQIYNPDASQPITHDMVTQYIHNVKKGDEGFEQKRKEVKKAHLSYFNMPLAMMKKSIVHPFYRDNYFEMMENIAEDKTPQWGASKEEIENTYKITAYRLFKEETNMMEEIIKKCWDKGITVGYVYDALYCLEINRKTVTGIMNQVAKERGILTTATS